MPEWGTNILGYPMRMPLQIEHMLCSTYGKVYTHWLWLNSKRIKVISVLRHYTSNLKLLTQLQWSKKECYILSRQESI